MANGDDARKFWIILGLSVLVLMGLRSYAAMRTNQAAKAAAIAAEVARGNAAAAADARRIAAEHASAENMRRLAAREDGGAATEYQKSLQASENYARGAYHEQIEELRRKIANGTAGQGDAAALANMEMKLARQAGGQKVAPQIAPPSMKPSTITRCDSGGCYDNLGGFYPSAGGAEFRGPGGQTCQMVNGTMNCF